ncbi:hypothetical protein HG536_0B04960 [Torulaspora globosa]|uniref:FAD-binding FR-type domain-containing protein n=1 Tax=Torulaspora globosa TaxID=48254 RepID=A0A7G3ZDP6_9SACH|nr:uncharacterized protein HG536_0B04960 [Torulaspora globosa]QLL31632.1 hypothetical protein HG536_0B04960 [Torulaspora globosa]
MKTGYIIWLLLACLPLGNGLVLIDSTLASACIYYELQYDWGCNSHGTGMKAYACRCKNINWLGTVTNCIRNNSDSTRLINHALRHVATRCLQKGHLHYSLDDMYRFADNGSQYLREPTLEDKSVTVNTTLLVNQTDFDWYHRKFKDYTFSVERSQWFGWGLVLYWAAIVGFATFFNLCRRLAGYSLANNWCRKHITLPSAFKDYRERTYFFAKIVPLNFQTRLHGLVVAVFVVLTIISVGVGYELKLPHPYLTTRWYANLNLVSYRTDLMAISLFPVIYLFGIRNNPLIYISGMPYSVFQFYHRWCAYTCAVLAFIHSIIWTVWAIADGGYEMWAMDAYWKWGIAATTLIVLLVFHSEKVIRDLAYEIFLVMHQFMNIAFIISMYYHCNTLGWLGWIWSMAGILCYDRFIRIVRIAISGGVRTATLIDCGNRSVIKMVMKKPKYFTYAAGSHAYVYFLSPTDSWYYFFQSHPFSIILKPEEDRRNPDNLVFYFKASKSITRAMLNKVMKSGRGSVTCKILLEGPYGTTIPETVKGVRKTVAVCAGLGISAVYPILRENSISQRQIYHKLIWIINDLTSLDWFHEELQWLKAQGTKISIVYTKADDKDVEASSKGSQTSESGYELEKLYSRPNLLSVVESEVQQASSEAVDLTIVSCGPPSFNDELRDSVVRSIAPDLKIDVELQEESYTW